MIQKIFKPYIFLFTVAILFLISAFCVKSKFVDLNFKDSYYLLPLNFVLGITASLLFLFSLLYWLLRAFLTKITLSYLHIAIMLLSILIFILIEDYFGRTLRQLIYIFPLCQLFFMINLYLGFSQRFK